MFNLRDISIRNKLVLMQVFTSVVVLGLCFAAFVVTHIKDYKQRKADSMISLAQVIGSNSIQQSGSRIMMPPGKFYQTFKK